MPAGGDIEDVTAGAARLGITPERVLEEYAHIAFADLSHIVKWGADGRLEIKPSSEVKPNDRAAISEIRRTGPGEGAGR